MISTLPKTTYERQMHSSFMNLKNIDWKVFLQIFNNTKLNKTNDNNKNVANFAMAITNALKTAQPNYYHKLTSKSVPWWTSDFTVIHKIN